MDIVASIHERMKGSFPDLLAIGRQADRRRDANADGDRIVMRRKNDGGGFVKEGSSDGQVRAWSVRVREAVALLTLVYFKLSR